MKKQRWVVSTIMSLVLLLALFLNACQPIQPIGEQTTVADSDYLTIAGNHGSEWHLQATDVKIIGGYGKENWGNLDYSGATVISVDGQAEVQVNSQTDVGTIVATFTGTIRPAKNKEFTGAIRLEFDVVGKQSGLPWREGGSADFIKIHGDSGQEAPLVPTVDCYLCTWGTGKLFVDGELIHEALSHFMWTPMIRDQNQIIWADETHTDHYSPIEPGKGIIARPDESQLHFVFMDPSVEDPDNFPPMAWFLKVNFDKVTDLSPQ